MTYNVLMVNPAQQPHSIISQGHAEVNMIHTTVRASQLCLNSLSNKKELTRMFEYVSSFG